MTCQKVASLISVFYVGETLKKCVNKKWRFAKKYVPPPHWRLAKKVASPQNIRPLPIYNEQFLPLYVLFMGYIQPGIPARESK